MLSPRAARAWNFTEHSTLGAEAYQAVCEQLWPGNGGPSPLGTLTEDQWRRLRIACELKNSRALQYGQLVALSGDHLSFEELRGIDANIAAKNFVGYLLRASHNAEHFHPMAPEQWRSYHGRALNEAVSAAKSGSDAAEVAAFWNAFYSSAYGDHFLEDSFASGHGGFNRAASSPTASEGFHRRANNEGRLLRDGAGREWRTYGDSHLEDCADQEGRRRVLKATMASVRELLVAFIVGRQSRALGRDVELRVPISGNSDCSDVIAANDNEQYVSWNQEVDDRFAKLWEDELAGRKVKREPLKKKTSLADLSPDCTLAWGSLRLVQEPASFAVAHTLGATELGRIRGGEHVVAATYAFQIDVRGLRFGLDAGWYWSTRERGNAGVLLAPTFSLPLGSKYGTVVGWDLDAKVLGLFPTLSYRGTAFDQHIAGTLGLALSVQLGRVNLRAAAGPAMVFSNQLAVDNDHWRNPGFGWYSQLGLQLVFSPEGGGHLHPPPI